MCELVGSCTDVWRVTEHPTREACAFMGSAGLLGCTARTVGWKEQVGDSGKWKVFNLKRIVWREGHNHGTHVKTKEQLCGVRSLLPALHGVGVQLRRSGLQHRVASTMAY